MCASAFELPFPDNSFDTIIMNDFMEHVSDPARTLKEALRLIRHPAPQGHLPVIGGTDAQLGEDALESFQRHFVDIPEVLPAVLVPGDAELQPLLFIGEALYQLLIGLYLAQLGIRPAYYREVPLRSWMAPLAKIPGIKEMFVKMGVCIIQKQ